MHAAGLPLQIMRYAATLPEGALLYPNALLHLGSRAAVDQALSRLTRAGSLLRICQGVYAPPVKTRFGKRSPSVEKVIPALSELWGETIVPSGAASANALRLTTQVPVQSVYLTSGASRKLHFGAQTVRLEHAPAWQLAGSYRIAGAAIRALDWLGPREVEENLETLKRTIPAPDLAELAAARSPGMPAWLAGPLSALAA